MTHQSLLRNIGAGFLGATPVLSFAVIILLLLPGCTSPTVLYFAPVVSVVHQGDSVSYEGLRVTYKGFGYEHCAPGPGEQDELAPGVYYLDIETVLGRETAVLHRNPDGQGERHLAGGCEIAVQSGNADQREITLVVQRLTPMPK